MALQHPLLKDGGILPPLLASLAQWHLIDDPEQGLGLGLTEALKATLREADGLKRALGHVSRAENLSLLSDRPVMLCRRAAGRGPGCFGSTLARSHGFLAGP